MPDSQEFVLPNWTTTLSDTTLNLIAWEWLTMDTPNFALNNLMGQIHVAIFRGEKDVIPSFGIAIQNMLDMPDLPIEKLGFHFDPQLEYEVDYVIDPRLNVYVMIEPGNDQIDTRQYLSFPAGFKVRYADDSGMPKLNVFNPGGEVRGAINIAHLSLISVDGMPREFRCEEDN